MPFIITEDVRDALLATEALSEDAVSALMMASADEDIGSWPRSRYGEIKGIGKAGAFAAFTVVHRFVAAQGITEQVAVSVPETPPYLDRPEDYDPHDPAQFWTAPETQQSYRWDGKRSNRFRWGEQHPVALVEHLLVDGVYVPNDEQAHRAIQAGFDWFHRGYGCWIGQGGKPYGSVDRDQRARVTRALDAFRERGPLMTALPA